MFVDVSYRGLRLAARAKLTETGPEAGFIEVEAPLPVGTRLALTGDRTLEARVVGVVEQESGAKSPPGMRIAWGAAAAHATRPAAAPAPPPVAAPAPTPTAPPAPAPAAPPAIVVVAPPATVIGDDAAAVPEPADAGSSGGFGPDESTPAAGGGDGRRRRRRKTQVGRP